MGNNILMIYMCLIWKWWLGVNLNVKDPYLHQGKVIQQSKLEQTWLFRVVLILINKLNEMQALDKGLNYNLAI